MCFEKLFYGINTEMLSSSMKISKTYVFPSDGNTYMHANRNNLLCFTLISKRLHAEFYMYANRNSLLRVTITCTCRILHESQTRQFSVYYIDFKAIRGRILHVCQTRQFIVCYIDFKAIRCRILHVCQTQQSIVCYIDFKNITRRYFTSTCKKNLQVQICPDMFLNPYIHGIYTMYWNIKMRVICKLFQLHANEISKSSL